MQATAFSIPVRMLLVSLFCFVLSTFCVTGASAQIGLSTQEAEDLRYMREEEKLARDVYRALYQQWEVNIFQNIATSEQRHMDAVLVLINAYGLSDPVAGLAEGSFSDAGLQQLYDSLLVQGQSSLEDALEVGILVEETDISDLEQAIARSSQPAIDRVYGNLLKGSSNHLSAFSNALAQLTGSTGPSGNEGRAVYEPISQTLYIPAINVTAANGMTRVYDALLRVVETVPVTLELLNSSMTGKLPSEEHAVFTPSNGLVLIPRFTVGSLQVDSIAEPEYSMTLSLVPGTAGSPLFVASEIHALD